MPPPAAVTAVQGLGLGGALLESRLVRCDEARLPAYLESSREENLAFYEHFGFRVTREPALPGRGRPPVRLMWREPGTIPSQGSDTTG